MVAPRTPPRRISHTVRTEHPMPRTPSARSVSRPPARRPRLQITPLEDRTVPTVLDLTGGTTSGVLNGGFFELMGQQPAGSGVIDSFVRLDSHGNSTTEEGHNSSGRNSGSPKLNFDENSSPTFTHDLQLKDIPMVEHNNNWYREFLLDVNEPNNNGAVPVSLNKVKVFTNPVGSILASGSDISELGTLRWDMDGTDAGTDAVPATGGGANSGPDDDSSGSGNWVALNDLNHGSGQSDMRVLVPESAFSGAQGTDFVYLFSRFGDTAAMSGGFEEWYVGQAENVIPVSVLTSIDKDLPGGGEELNVTDVSLGSTVHDHAFVIDGSTANFVTTGSVTFSFWAHPVGFTGDPCSGDPTAIVTDSDGSDGWYAQPPAAMNLHAGVYAFSARYNGDGTFAAGTADCEPLTVEKANLTISTQIHDANHSPVGGSTDAPL